MGIAKARPFAIVASQRTGSTLLARSLDASPFVFCAGELFHGGPHVHHPEFNFPHDVLGSRALGRLVDIAFGKRRVHRHLTHYFAVAGKGVQAVGFKIMASQLRHHRSVLSVLTSLDTTLLFLYRRDTFATALSYYRAKASGIYHSDRVAAKTRTMTITADIKKFREQLNHCESEKAGILRLHAATSGTLLAYEDMTSDWNSFIEAVGLAIGVPGLQIPRTMDKLDSATPRVRIANEEVLRREFANYGRK